MTESALNPEINEGVGFVSGMPETPIRRSSPPMGGDDATASLRCLSAQTQMTSRWTEFIWGFLH